MHDLHKRMPAMAAVTLAIQGYTVTIFVLI